MKLKPDLPSVIEQTSFKQWSVLVSAKGTPPEIIGILNKAVNEALSKPQVIERLENLGLKPLYGDVKSAQELVQTEIAEKKRVIELIGLRRE